ncbi:MAG: RluA family pseudouridine synthase [Helicobacteraceae bacterium]|jgi:23S rRNA pseudouridine1911/1915/1917 synthase|nr:RluA family pseudouridine synthase [Helicobacteraceae bacterium]
MAYKFVEFELTSPTKAVYALMRELKIARGEAQRLIDKRRVTLNGEILREKDLIAGVIKARVWDSIGEALAPVFTAPDFAIFDKPPFMLAHPNGFDSGATLLDAARLAFGEIAQLCHRIDRETSGLVAISRNKIAEAELKDLFAARLAGKTYLAWVRGRLEFNGVIDEPIAQGTRERNAKLGLPKVIGAASRDQGKAARTFARTIAVFECAGLDGGAATLVEAKPVTGRTHQIRIHLAHIGFPILGDALYGANVDAARLWLDRALDRKEKIALTGADRLMLHADSLEFCYKRSRFFIKSAPGFASFETLQNHIG